MKRVVALVTSVILLLTSLPGAYAQAAEGEVYLREDFGGEALSGEWQTENIDGTNGNGVLVSDSQLKITRAASAAEPIISRAITPATGRIMLEFSGRNSTGSERCQDVLILSDANGKQAAKFRFFGNALHIKTADTTNANGDLDYTVIATGNGKDNIATKVILDTNNGTVDVINPATGEIILESKKFISSLCKDISKVTLKGTSRFYQSSATADVFIDYINIYEFYESTAQKDILTENWQIPSEAAESFEVPTKGAFGSEYTWESSDEDVIRFDGSQAKVYPLDGEDKTVVITVTAKNGSHFAIKEFTVMVKEKKWYNYYLTEDMQGPLGEGIKFGADSTQVYDAAVGECMYTRSQMLATLPDKQSGVVYLAMKLKITESATIEAFAEGAGDSTTSFTFSTDGKMTIRVDANTKRRANYKKGEWFDFKVRMDYVNFNCDVWIDGALKLEKCPFEYEKASYNIERIKFTTDLSGFYIKDLEVYRDSYDAVSKDIDAVSVPDEIASGINLPLIGAYGSSIVWESDREDVIEIPAPTATDLADGIIRPTLIRPFEDTDVVLTAEVCEGEYSKRKKFNVKVIHEFTDEETVKYISDRLDIGDESQILGDLFLPEAGENGTRIVWESDNESVLTSKGVVTRADHQDGSAKLKATVTKNGTSCERVFNVTVPKRFAPIVDPDIISDEKFFGVWSGSGWEVEPEINYDYNQETGIIGEYAKKGDYAAAMQAMLDYYRERINNKTIPVTDVPTARDENLIKLVTNEIWNFSQREPYITTFRVTNEKKEVMVDISKGFRSKKPSTYMLTSLTKGKCKTVIDSSEGNNPPRLELVINGSKKSVPAVYDTFVRAGWYMHRNYGEETQLTVCDSGAPTDDDTTRAYVSFDISFLNANDTINSAKLVFDASTDASTGYQDILVFNSGLQVYDENDLSWAKIPHKTYSWNAVPGGYRFDAQPDQDHHWQGWVANADRWAGPMIAEYNLTSDEFYPYYVISQMIKLSECGITDIDTRDVISHLINNQYMTPEAFTAIMKLSAVRGNEIYNDYQKRVDNLGFVSPDYAVFFPEFTDSASWWDVLDENIRYLLDGGLVLSDGSYIESCNHYELYVVGYMLSTYKAFVNEGKKPPEGLRDALETLILYIFNMTEPSLQITEWGDTTNTGGSNVKNSLTNWLAALPDMEIAEYAEYVLSDGASGEKPPFNSHFYPEGQLAVFRSDWNKDAVYSFINNRTGGIHLHPDALSLNVYAYGRRLLTDAGLSSYDNDDPISYWQRFRTSAHNTIEINDNSQTAPYNSDKSLWAAAESEMIINGGYDMFTGWNDSNRDGTKIWRHSRNVLFVRPKFFIVSDLVTPPDDTQINKYNQTWHTERFAQMSMDAETGIAKTNYSSGANAKILSLDPEKLSMSLQEGYPYGQKAKYASYVQNAKGAVSYDTIIYPYEGGRDVNISAERIELDVPTTTATAFKLDIDGEASYYYYSHEETPKMRSFGDFETDAKMAYIETGADGSVRSISLANARVVKLSGKVIFKAKNAVGDIKISEKDGTICIDSQSEEGKTKIDAQYLAGNTIDRVILSGTEIGFVEDEEYIIFSSDVSGFTALDELSFNAESDAQKLQFTKTPSKVTVDGIETEVESYFHSIDGEALKMTTDITVDVSALDENYIKKEHNGYTAQYSFDELAGKVNISYKFKVDKGVERIRNLAFTAPVILRLMGNSIQAKTGDTKTISGDFVTVKEACVERGKFYSIDILADYDNKAVSVYFDGECIIDRHAFYSGSSSISGITLGGVSKVSLRTNADNQVNTTGSVWYDDITVTKIRNIEKDNVADNLSGIKGEVKDGRLSFEYKSYNFGEEDAKRIIIGAIYDENNNLIECKTLNADALADSASYGVITHTYNESMNGYKYRFFVWNSFDAMTSVKVIDEKTLGYLLE